MTSPSDVPGSPSLHRWFGLLLAGIISLILPIMESYRVASWCPLPVEKAPGLSGPAVDSERGGAVQFPGTKGIASTCSRVGKRTILLMLPGMQEEETKRDPERMKTRGARIQRQNRWTSSRKDSKRTSSDGGKRLNARDKTTCMRGTVQGKKEVVRDSKRMSAKRGRGSRRAERGARASH
ncbi:hypothetical protein C8R44DRAFT_958901 [Mycena epipterygia]|nr:hypothetical protein C8R44DRAFT_958901 [Mycena epipterygia]